MISDVARVLRIIINGFSFVLLLLLSFIVWQSNTLLAFFLALASIDQFEDVYYYAYGKRLFPAWLRPLDILLELFLAGIGTGIFFFSLIYYTYFETWFFRALMFISFLIVYSALEDVVVWTRPIQTPATTKMVMQYVCQKERREEVCEEKKFVKRK